MWRVILLLAALLFVGNATGLIPEGDNAACTDEDAGKDCPPMCPTCTCAWHTLTSAPATPVELETVTVATCTVESPSPDDGCGLLPPAPVLRPPIAAS